MGNLASVEDNRVKHLSSFVAFISLFLINNSGKEANQLCQCFTHVEKFTMLLFGLKSIPLRLALIAWSQ